MEYQKKIAFSGDSAEALVAARMVLMNHNFRIESTRKSELSAAGPGMQSTKQNPLTGATRVRLLAEDSSLLLSAELGGLRWMRNFLYLFPPSLALVLSLFFLLPPMPDSAVFLPWLVLSPWLVISPLIVKWIRRRTITALDNLLHNAKAAGESPDG